MFAHDSTASFRLHHLVVSQTALKPEINMTLYCSYLLYMYMYMYMYMYKDCHLYIACTRAYMHVQYMYCSPVHVHVHVHLPPPSFRPPLPTHSDYGTEQTPGLPPRRRAQTQRLPLSPHYCKQEYEEALSPYEHKEIEEYPDIWYLGLESKKIDAHPGTSQNCGELWCDDCIVSVFP